MSPFTKNISLFLSILFLNGCFLIFDREPEFTSIYIELVNDSSLVNCSRDSIDIAFLVSNISADSTKKVNAEVNWGQSQSINVLIKRDEILKVKVFDLKDNFLLIEKEFKVGKGVNQWNDPPPRTITFCKKSGLRFENF